MKNARLFQSLFAVVAALMLAMPIAAQQQDASTTPANKDQMASATVATVPAGQKQKLTGIIVQRDVDNLMVRDYKGATYKVNVSGNTSIKERKSNPFRGAKKYAVSDLSRGLAIEVEGRGDANGILVANQIKFSEAEYRVANSVVSLVTPVEGRVTDAEGRLTQSEDNAKRLSGQIEELSAVANTANGGAKAAQEAADKAMAAANSANERITTTAETLNSRISSLDNFEVAKTININFRVGSSKLSADAKAALDEIAEEAKGDKGQVIQVAGFASSDGNETLNRRLSRERADAVMSYLIENHDINQRRIVTPIGYGESHAAADNATRDGRQQNRRVEVAILVSKGLSSGSTASVSSNTSNNQ